MTTLPSTTTIVGTSLASRKTQDLTLQDFSRKTLVARLARRKFTKKTLFFWPKLGIFSNKNLNVVMKKFFSYFFHDFYSEKLTVFKHEVYL